MSHEHFFKFVFDCLVTCFDCLSGRHVLTVYLVIYLVNLLSNGYLFNLYFTVYLVNLLLIVYLVFFP